jgi:hypothetical protein
MRVSASCSRHVPPLWSWDGRALLRQLFADRRHGVRRAPDGPAGGRPAAEQEFRVAAAQAGELLQQTSGAYAAQDTRALAGCGLALTAHADQAEAIADFRAARAITSAEGIVKQVLALFDALAACDNGGVLTGVRPAAEGSG